MIIDDVLAVQSQARHDPMQDAVTIARLRRLLAEAIRQREHLVFANLELYRRSRHWFADDGQGYCLACNTVAANGRHTERAA